jgi:hypothetical protein
MSSSGNLWGPRLRKSRNWIHGENRWKLSFSNFNFRKIRLSYLKSPLGIIISQISSITRHLFWFSHETLHFYRGDSITSNRRTSWQSRRHFCSEVKAFTNASGRADGPTLWLRNPAPLLMVYHGLSQYHIMVWYNYDITIPNIGYIGYNMGCNMM